MYISFLKCNTQIEIYSCNEMNCDEFRDLDMHFHISNNKENAQTLFAPFHGCAVVLCYVFSYN